MHYEVRYLIGGDEQVANIEADSAAEAAQLAQVASHQTDAEAAFELIQVQLLDETSDEPTSTSPDREDIRSI